MPCLLMISRAIESALRASVRVAASGEATPDSAVRQSLRTRSSTSDDGVDRDGADRAAPDEEDDAVDDLRAFQAAYAPRHR